MGGDVIAFFGGGLGLSQRGLQTEWEVTFFVELLPPGALSQRGLQTEWEVTFLLLSRDNNNRHNAVFKPNGR